MTRKILFGVLFGIAVYVGIVLWTDSGALLEALGRLPLWAFPAALACSLVNYALRFLKWEHYLRLLDIRVARRTSLSIYLSGYAMGVTPGKVGELLKSWMLRRVTGTRIHTSAPIILAERVTDLLGCLILIGAGGLVSHPELAWVFWVTLVLCATLVVFAGSRRAARLVLRLAGRLPRGASIARRVDGALLSSRALLAPRRLLLPTAISAAGWSAECFGFWILGQSLLPEGDLSISFALFAYATGSVVGALALFLPGGLGATEWALGSLFRREAQAVANLTLEAARPLAVGATLLTRLATLWFGVLVGLVAFFWFQRRYGHIEPDSAGDLGSVEEELA